MVLADIKIGENVKVAKIDLDARTQKRLNDMGLIEGVSVKLITYAPLGDPLLIKVRDFMLAIRKEDAKNITVKKL